MKTRKKGILNLLKAEGNCSVSLLARRLDVCQMTIRRELHLLEREGRVVRTHGGAMLAEKVAFEFNFLQRTQVNSSAKEAIAAVAIGQLRDARVVMLDSGTTTLALADLLRMRSGLTVITASLPVAAALQFCAGIEILLLGGIMRRDAPNLGGPMAEANLESLHADVAFISADAIDEKGGVYDNSLCEGSMLSKMAERAGRVYVLADSSKLGKSGLMRFGQLEKWTMLITDSRADKAQLEALENAGIKVIVAPLTAGKKAEGILGRAVQQHHTNQSNQL